MTNSNKTLLALSLLALAACGGDDDKGVTPVDGGSPVKVIPVIDSGAQTGVIITPGGGGSDAGTTVVITPVGVDAGSTVTPSGDCFTGTPVQQADFLNRCTTSQTTTKTLAVPPALLTANGGVVAL
jgi:hypothetical protein